MTKFQHRNINLTDLVKLGCMCRRRFGYHWQIYRVMLWLFRRNSKQFLISEKPISHSQKLSCCSCKCLWWPIDETDFWIFQGTVATFTASDEDKFVSPSDVKFSEDSIHQKLLKLVYLRVSYSKNNGLTFLDHGVYIHVHTIIYDKQI